MENITLTVGGMTCMGCVSSVKRVLAAIPGIASAEVTLQPGQATVSYDPAKTSRESISSAIRDAGYDVA
ncbi:MAG: heavy-metal-associated domain-containing protein [Betaproteobacteria bacterium]|nr:heavy-metal-associated domain-containing protein [Betaproteobacteria bacterium]